MSVFVHRHDLQEACNSLLQNLIGYKIENHIEQSFYVAKARTTFYGRKIERKLVRNDRKHLSLYDFKKSILGNNQISIVKDVYIRLDALNATWIPITGKELHAFADFWPRDTRFLDNS